MYESRFLGSIDGGHVACGHRRRAVGDEDFPRCVNIAVTGVEQSLRPRRGSRKRYRFRGGGSLSFLRQSSSGNDTHPAFSKLRDPTRSSRHFLVSSPHALQRLSDDRGPASPRPAASLCLLSMGQFRALIRSRRRVGKGAIAPCPPFLSPHNKSLS